MNRPPPAVLQDPDATDSTVSGNQCQLASATVRTAAAPLQWLRAPQCTDPELHSCAPLVVVHLPVLDGVKGAAGMGVDGCGELGPRLHWAGTSTTCTGAPSIFGGHRGDSPPSTPGNEVGGDDKGGVGGVMCIGGWTHTTLPHTHLTAKLCGWKGFALCLHLPML